MTRVKILDQYLRDLCKDSLVFEYPYEKVWNNRGISLVQRLSSDPILSKKLNVILTPENIKKYICSVSSNAPTRCIDGRITKNWKPRNSSVDLGPKIAGGTPHAALTHRIVDTDSLKANLRFEDDIKYVVEKYKKIGIGFGGHLDDHATGWNTGCGAVDNINLILEKLQLPEPQEQLRLLTQLLLGKTYEGHHTVNEVIGRMLYLDALKPRYMPKLNDEPAGEFLYKKTVANLLQSHASSHHVVVPQLTGHHQEVGVVLNFVKDTTFDSDKFSYDNSNEIQLFAWDIWEVFEEARRLYPYSLNDTPTKQHNAVQSRIKHVTTRTLLGIATTMVLTDGSLKVIEVR